MATVGVKWLIRLEAIRGRQNLRLHVTSIDL